MIVLDTNLWLRYLLNDDPAQAQRVRRLLEKSAAVSITPSILLELVWVLECCDCTRAEIVTALRHLLGLPNMLIGNESGMFRAVQWYEQGLEFGDAVHLASAPATATLVTFDRDFVTRAKRADAFPAVVLCPK
jgi:predicted nucleic-acid-binding protein